MTIKDIKYTMSERPDYFTRLAAAFVRGSITPAPVDDSTDMWTRPLDDLTEDEMHVVIAVGAEHALRLHRFKRTMGLPRVMRVLGTLRGIQPSNLLDIGSGRGAFLWPLLDTFPHLPVTALDVLEYRVRDLEAVRAGGVTTLTPLGGDVRDLPYPDRAFDVVTMLEVLEHIPDTRQALAEVCRVAARFVILSVPSQPDTNPEHIHLFDAATLTDLLRQAGAVRVSIDYVPNHIIAVARMADA